MVIRGLAVAMNASGRFTYKPPESVVDHLIVGGGVVGLAIAERLSKLYPYKSTFLVERHGRAGEETSSRNSEVIHAGRVIARLQSTLAQTDKALTWYIGIYYPPKSLKALLCVRGRQRMYQRCLDHNIPHKRVGKLVVAGRGQRGYLDKLLSRIPLLLPSSEEPKVPLELISGAEAREMQPDLSPDIEYALHSPTTGIVDSHAFMESFEKDIGESESGELVYSTRVVRVDPYRSDRSPTATSPDGTSEGWVVQTLTSPEPEGNQRNNQETRGETSTDTLLTRVLINASGLNANMILNSLLPAERLIAMYYPRGSYASYRGPGVGSVSKLIYPVPELSAGDSDPSSFQSLGTHLTLDMDGNVRFGPDIEWLTPPAPSGYPEKALVVDESAVDFWVNHLVADDSRSKMEAIHRSVTKYFPDVALEGLRADYVGIRPKLVGPTAGFQDFEVRVDRTADFGGSGNAPMISLLGIESPGLTASMAIAEYVVDYLESSR